MPTIKVIADGKIIDQREMGEIEFARWQLGRKLKSIRSGGDGVAHVTQDELARLAGVSRATIIGIESATTDVRLSTLVHLARALDVPVSLFFEW